jgi:hypothetical protein
MNDTLKPSQPGYYWWKNIAGENHIAYFMYNNNGVLYDALVDCTVDEFETGCNFKRWLGLAEPPR